MLSDRYQHRHSFVIGGILMGVLGYAILLAQTQYPHMPVGAKYFALFPLISASLVVQPLTVSWMMNNISGYVTQAS